MKVDLKERKRRAKGQKLRTLHLYLTKITIISLI